jgi:predicted DNA-binding transcriptional regulator YafY
VAHQIVRLLRLLQLIPREPDSIGVKELVAKLEQGWMGHDFLPRTGRRKDRGVAGQGARTKARAQTYRSPLERRVQQDLDLLATEIFQGAWERENENKPKKRLDKGGRLRGPLQAVRDGNSNRYRWSWAKDAQVFSVPQMGVPEAIALDTVHRFLADLLPSSVFESLRHYFDVADSTLRTAEASSRRRRWREKVRIALPVQPRIPAKVSRKTFQVVTDALMQEEQISFTYQKPRAEPKRFTNVNPLVLIYWGETPELLATMGFDETVRRFPLRRVQNVERLSGHRAIRPHGFDVDQWLADGGMGVPRQGAARSFVLEARIRGPRSETLDEAPYGKDQVVTPDVDGWKRLRVTVNNTEQLRWWLLGFGADAEVISPSDLRAEMQLILGRLSRLYLGSGDLSPNKDLTEVSHSFIERGVIA